MVGVGEGAESASTTGASSRQRSKEISEGGKGTNILLQRPDEEKMIERQRRHTRVVCGLGWMYSNIKR